MERSCQPPIRCSWVGIDMTGVVVVKGVEN
jgi:hypothetical protein